MFDTESYQLLIPAVAAFIPLVVPFINYTDRKDELYLTDRYIKRLDLLTRVEQTTRANSLDLSPDHQEIIKNEIQAILKFLGSTKKLQTETSKNLPAMSQARQILLLFKPASFIISLYRALFFFFSFCSLTILAIIIYKLQFSSEMVVTLTIYALLAFLFRKIAIKKQIRNLSIR